MIEEWRPVIGHEGKYEISNWGRVRSLSRWVPRIRPDRSDTRMWCRGKVLAPRFCSSGHAGVQLTLGEYAQIHRLVLEAFVGPCPPGKECLHDDGDEANNQLGNLSWGTRQKNLLDRKRHTPSNNGLHYEEVVQIKLLLAAGSLTGRAIARKFAVFPSLVSAIRVGKKHADVTVDL